MGRNDGLKTFAPVIVAAEHKHQRVGADHLHAAVPLQHDVEHDPVRVELLFVHQVSGIICTVVENPVVLLMVPLIAPVL